MIYIAYGANLNKKNMKIRSPNALPLGVSQLKNYKLIFNNVASIIKSKDDRVEVVLWKITKECEKALDRFEGFPEFYRKEYLDQGMVYIMNHEGIALPNESYLATIVEGYSDFDLDRTYLDKALIEAYDQ